MWGNEANFMAIAIIWLFTLLFTVFFLPETLNEEHRKDLSLLKYNPFSPLRDLCVGIKYNPVVFWIAIVEFFVSLPETGVLDTMLVYVLDDLSIESETIATEISGLVIGLCGIGIILSNFLLLPLFKKYFTDYKIILISVVFFVTSMLLFAFAHFVKDILILYIIILICACLLVTSGLVAFPAANSIVARHVNKSEQGIAFGIVYAVRSLTYMIAPFSFGYGYTLAKKNGMTYLVYIVGASICACVIPVIIGPLRKTLRDTEKYNLKYTFSNISNSQEVGIMASSSNSKKSKTKGPHQKVNYQTIDLNQDVL